MLLYEISVVNVPEQLVSIIIIKVRPEIWRRETHGLSSHNQCLRRTVKTKLHQSANTQHTDISAQKQIHHPHTYGAGLLLVPFGTTAPPLAWVPLAPIPRFGSGNSINNRDTVMLQS